MENRIGGIADAGVNSPALPKKSGQSLRRGNPFFQYLHFNFQIVSFSNLSRLIRDLQIIILAH